MDGEKDPEEYGRREEFTPTLPYSPTFLLELADLHLHTNHSDGTSTPEEVVKQARLANLKAISITDHDAVSGIDLAMAVARELGIEVIPGVELSVTYQGKDIHILGYFIDYKDKKFLDYLELFKIARIRRVEKMIAQLNRKGLPIRVESVLAKAGSGAVGRPHIAEVLVEEGYVASYEEAFQKYLGDQGPIFAEKYPLSPEEGIALIQSIGGVSVLAHPGCYNQDEIIPELAKKGLDGIETTPPQNFPGDPQHYARMAQRYHLLESGGSDYHGERGGGTPMGTRAIPYSFVEKLRQRAGGR